MDDELPKIIITYCSQCNWMLRASWLAQEILQTFGNDIGEICLRPRKGGIFTIEVNGALIWDRKRNNGFPEAKILKQIWRDHLWPERELGHIDRHIIDGDMVDRRLVDRQLVNSNGAKKTD